MQDQGTKHIVFDNGEYDEFPLNKHLCVIANVKEKASGVELSKLDNSAVFTDHLVKLDCDLMSSFYRPSFPLQMQVRFV